MLETESEFGDQNMRILGFEATAAWTVCQAVMNWAWAVFGGGGVGLGGWVGRRGGGGGERTGVGLGGFVLTASGICGPASWRDVVVYFVGEAEPYFHALRCELIEDAGDVVCDGWGDLREGESRWHNGWDEDGARGNDVGHDAEQLVA